MATKVTAKARSREDRAGDPLDGLVNLFDIGIILSVAFLLAALSSLNLTEEFTSQGRTTTENTAPADSVVTGEIPAVATPAFTMLTGSAKVSFSAVGPSSVTSARGRSLPVSTRRMNPFCTSAFMTALAAT